MPRHNYKPGRRKQPDRRAGRMLDLEQEMRHRFPVRRETRPCTVCGGSLPGSWPYPEHAGCRHGGEAA